MGGPEVKPQLNGLCPEVPSPFSVASTVDELRWAKAEAWTAQLLTCIQPSKHSDDHRRAIVLYVQELIQTQIGHEVHFRIEKFGSVPLRTYLPDGDIDLTILSTDEHLKDRWVSEVCSALKKGKSSREFRVREPQTIDAEVKVVKCIVDNVTVDISFNQRGGLCSLRFLEDIDSKIGRNHLFKRSIIIVKAWCYYESRLLGANCGLIATYALEVMVLYIFHVFNSTLSGPLEVLLKFLEFFSSFNWDQYCLSLSGPIPLCSVSESAAAEPARLDGGKVLFSEAFLQMCNKKYAVDPTSNGSNGQKFSPKTMNIVDPLLHHNNLGRSINKGSAGRIRYALGLGSRSLRGIMSSSRGNLNDELKRFFRTTWQRVGCPETAVPSSFMDHTESSRDLTEQVCPPSSHGAKGATSQGYVKAKSLSNGESQRFREKLSKAAVEPKISLQKISPGTSVSYSHLSADIAPARYGWSPPLTASGVKDNVPSSYTTLQEYSASKTNVPVPLLPNEVQKREVPASAGTSSQLAASVGSSLRYIRISQRLAESERKTSTGNTVEAVEENNLEVRGMDVHGASFLAGGGECQHSSYSQTKVKDLSCWTPGGQLSYPYFGSVALETPFSSLPSTPAAVSVSSVQSTDAGSRRSASDCSQLTAGTMLLRHASFPPHYLDNVEGGTAGRPLRFSTNSCFGLPCTYEAQYRATDDVKGTVLKAGDV